MFLLTDWGEIVMFDLRGGQEAHFCFYLSHFFFSTLFPVCLYFILGFICEGAVGELHAICSTF